MSAPRITKESLEGYRRQAVEAGLEGAGFLTSMTDEDILTICNGIGPEWFPASLRTMVDRFHPSLIVVSMIHDIMYHVGDGTDEDFRNANRIFRENGYRMAKLNYGWYNPARYKVEYDAWKFGRMCDRFGRTAYDQAIEDRKRSCKG